MLAANDAKHVSLVSDQLNNWTTLSEDNVLEIWEAEEKNQFWIGFAFAESLHWVELTVSWMWAQSEANWWLQS